MTEVVTRIKNGRVLHKGKFESLDLYFSPDGICSVGTKIPYGREIDADGAYVCPGFVDIHCHGGGGADFSDADEEAVKNAALTHLRHGTTTLFPTVTSLDIPSLERAIRAVGNARSASPSLAGIHLEGPYFSPAQSGAQKGDILKTPRPEEYERILENYKIARWDYAPELDSDGRFLRALTGHGVIAAAAHTDATCVEMEKAAKEGCWLITHLYSCTSTIKREKGFRVAGVTEAAYLLDDVSVELIADGCHLPYELLRLAYKLKGADRIALVTDAMRVAGTAYEGESNIGDVKCIIEDGVAKLPDRSAFAGSIATADRLVRTAVRAEIPLEDAVKMMSETPARIMGLERKGKLEAGYDADIVIFDADINIKQVILAGETVWF